MTTTDDTQTHLIQDETQPADGLYDADASPAELSDRGEDFTLDGGDYTWQSFVEALSDTPKGKELKVRILLAVAVCSRGKAGWTVDWDEVGEHIHRQKGSLTNYVPELVDEGWFTKEPGISKENRPIFIHKTAKSIRG